MPEVSGAISPGLSAGVAASCLFGACICVPPGVSTILRQAALNAVDHATDKAGDKAVKDTFGGSLMADGYRIIGAEMSPYSVKLRSYFRYKGIPHQWVLRNAASQAEFE